MSRSQAIAVVAAACAASWLVVTRAQTPAIPDMSGRIMTVTGPIAPAALGPTLMHEHIFIEFQSPRPQPRTFRDAEAAAAYEQPIALDNLHRLRYGGGGVRGGNFLADFDLMEREVLEFKKMGGQAIVDMSNIGLGRDPVALAQMSNLTGLSIIMGASWYTKSYHPLDMDRRTIDELTAVIVNDVAVGAQGTGIRSGIIGEVGVDGNPLTANEIKVIRASARAARLTGAPMQIHRGGDGAERLQTLDAIALEGTDMSKVVMGHSSIIAGDMPLMKQMLGRGVYIGFDYLGIMTGPRGVLGPRSDRTVATAIVDLIALGYGDRIVLSHDICTKPQLKAFGGGGFSYVSEHFLPELRRLGVKESDIHRIMVENPRRALTFASPKAALTASTAAR